MLAQGSGAGAGAGGGGVNVPGEVGPGTKTPTDAASSAAASGEPASEITVSDVPFEQVIMPNQRPTDSVYGTDTNVQDTPRNVTIISREQLSAVDIQDPRDFSKLSSDSFTQSNFGAPANPSIRGQSADVFINGMRRGLTSNGNGFPLDFNSVESVDIVKGPGNAIYGASQYTGGYVDEITKQPFFDKFQGDVGTTIGMYQVYRWSADVGGPLIKNELAFRLSYTGEDSGSYYDYSHKQSESVYGALTWTPKNTNYSVALTGEFAEADYNENNGINRVTQNLIDNDKYITGTVENPNNLPNNEQIGQFFNPVVAGPTVNLDHALHIIGSQDGSYGKTGDIQAIQTITVNDGFKIIDNTLYERIDRRTYNSQQFDEALKDNAAVDNRLEFIWDTDIPILSGMSRKADTSKDKDAKEVAKDSKKDDKGLIFHNQLNAGLEFRFQNNTNYDTFAYEPFDAFDITQPISTVFIPTSNNLAAGQYHIPGEPSYYVFTPNNGDNAHSELYEFGPYIQDTLKFTDKLSLLFGARVDILYVDAQSPAGTPHNLVEVMSTTQALPNFNISPTFKPVPWLTTYFTYNYSQSTNTGDGGDYSPTFTSHDFHQPSNLFEVGAKATALKNTLFFTTTGYVQNRENPSQGGTSVKIEVKGLEFELYYQPNKHFYATTSYSLLDSHTVDPGFTHEYLPITTSDNVAPGTILLTDVPPPGFSVPNGHYRTPGYPEHLFNTLLTYKTDFGLGASADLQVTSPMTVSYDGTVKIHWQYNVDFSVFYTYKRYEARVGIYNATNQHNWDPANPIYGNESIFADEPIHVEGTFKIKF